MKYSTYLQASAFKNFVIAENKNLNTDFNFDCFPKIDAFIDLLETAKARFRILSVPEGTGTGLVISFFDSADLYLILSCATKVQFTNIILHNDKNTVLLNQEAGVSKILIL